MDLSNLLGDVTGSGGGGADAASLTAAFTQLVESHGGVQGLIAKLQAGGLGDAVSSWISNGANQPVAPEQLAAALGPDTVKQLAASSGLDVNSLLPLLASILPMVVDHLTAGGSLPQAGGVGDLSGLGGLIGSVFGGSLLGNASAAGGGGVVGELGSLGGILGDLEGK